MAIHYITHNGTDTYANATSFSTPCSFATAATNAAAGDEIRICATATYTLSASQTWANSGNTTSGRILVVGANSSGTVDGTRPTITSSTNSVCPFQFNNGAGGYVVRLLKFTHTAATRGPATAGTGTAGQANIKVEDCWVDGCSYLWDGGSRVCAGLSVVNCYATNCTSGVILNGGGAGDTIDGCFFYSNTGACYSANNQSTTLVIRRSFLCKNGRAVTDASGGSVRTMTLYLYDSVIANNTTEGVTNGNAAMVWTVALANNIIYGNGGYGVDLLNTQAANDFRAFEHRNNFTGSNTSGNYNNLSAGYNDVALSADPFTNAAAGDFSLNTTAGGGAAVRAAGFPSAFTGGLTTGYLDGGAAQHQDSGGGPPRSVICTSIGTY